MKRSVAIGIAPYLVILLVCAYLLYHAFGIAPGGEQGQLGADFWPKTVLLLAILTCGGEIAAILRGGGAGRARASEAADLKRLASLQDAEDKPAEIAPWVPWVGIALVSAYVLLFSELGYFLATLFFVTAFIYFGNHRRPIVAASVGLTASLAFMFVFMKIVYVSLPMGAGPFGRLSGLIMTAMGIK